jgi:hypothetical protein
VSAAGRWFASPHAVRRFARHALGWKGTDEEPLPESTYRRALAEIVRESLVAHFVRRYPVKEGHVEADLWRGPRPRRLRYVVAVRLAEGAALPSLVTVLPTCDRRVGLDASARPGYDGTEP